MTSGPRLKVLSLTDACAHTVAESTRVSDRARGDPTRRLPPTSTAAEVQDGRLQARRGRAPVRWGTVLLRDIVPHGDEAENARVGRQQVVDQRTDADRNRLRRPLREGCVFRSTWAATPDMGSHSGDPCSQSPEARAPATRLRPLAARRPRALSRRCLTVANRTKAAPLLSEGATPRREGAELPCERAARTIEAGSLPTTSASLPSATLSLLSEGSSRRRDGTALPSKRTARTIEVGSLPTTPTSLPSATTIAGQRRFLSAPRRYCAAQ